MARRLFQIILLSFLGFAVAVAPVEAQTNYSGSAAYHFGGIPGTINPNGGNNTNVFSVDVGGSGKNFLGCGGVDLVSYFKATFDMHNLIEQLKANLQSMLAKTLLTAAMSIPQVAAIFDTLNAFGNMRFNLFQQSCNLGQIRKDAKEMFRERCLGDDKSAARQEYCDKYWTNNSNVGSWFSSVLQQIHGLENVNQVLRQPMCDPNSTLGSVTGGCSAMAFLPQFRLCINLGGSTFNHTNQNGSTSTTNNSTCVGNYGTSPPVLSLQTTVDGIRNLANAYAGKAVAGVQQYRAEGVPKVAMEASINAARAKCADPTYTCGGTAPTQQATQADSVEGRFKKYIGCDIANTPDPLAFMREISKQLQQIYPGVSGLDLTLSDADATQLIQGLVKNSTALQQMGVDAQSAAKLLQIGTACILANSLKIDPHSLTNLVYDEDADCAAAWDSGLSVRVGHMMAGYLYPFLRDEVKKAKVRLMSDDQQWIKYASATSSGGKVDAGSVPADMKKKILDALDAMDATLAQQMESEKSKYKPIKDNAAINALLDSGSCTHAAATTPADADNSSE